MANLREFRLDNIIEYKGLWSLSAVGVYNKNRIETAVRGTLKINNGKIRLEINGKLKSYNVKKTYNSFDIFGYLSNGLYVKLEKCYIISINFPSPGYPTESYMATRGFILIKNDDNIISKTLQATQVRISLNYLEDWYDINLPTINNVGDDGSYSIDYNNDFFDNNNYEILDGKYYVKLVRNITQNYNIHKGVMTEVESYIKINSKGYEPKPIDNLLDLAFWFKDFINFITQIFGNLTECTYLLEDNVNRIWIEKIKKDEYIYHRPYYEGKLIFNQLSFNNDELNFYSLRLSNVYKDFGLLINEWFKNKDNLDYIISLYNQNQKPNLDINTKLVNQIKILEAYYDNYKVNKREKITDKENKLNKTKTKLKDYLNLFDVEEGIKEEIIKNINHSSKNKNPTLREKLNVILESLPENFKIIFYDIDSEWDRDDKFIDKFAVKLKDTRNYHTHGANPDKNKNRYKSTKEIIRVNQVLDYIIYFLVLKVLGLDEKKILNYPFIKYNIME
ncbi:HEPN domain-containing protein [uncultured Anaerococcus sp.]|uniref:HEPN domain-containing protein n=1 Tax=uncultured Anaerococcus sp. TaxID=293428 RepID=UPI00288B5F4A|nr:HEPN domain-containing protein [uncultured Anaerococcus sp.]